MIIFLGMYRKSFRNARLLKAPGVGSNGSGGKKLSDTNLWSVKESANINTN